MKITFPDGNGKVYEKGVTAFQVAQDISPRLAKDALAAEADGKVIGLAEPINEDNLLKILTWNTFRAFLRGARGVLPIIISLIGQDY